MRSAAVKYELYNKPQIRHFPLPFKFFSGVMYYFNSGILLNFHIINFFFLDTLHCGYSFTIYLKYKYKQLINDRFYVIYCK